MARQSELPIKSGTTNKTPAPNSNSGEPLYGQNGFAGSSSDTPGKRTTSALASAFDDPVLATVRDRGAKSNENYGNAKPLPTTPGNKPSTPNPARVPNGNGGCED
jgi:hypothetical protein